MKKMLILTAIMCFWFLHVTISAAGKEGSIGAGEYLQIGSKNLNVTSFAAELLNGESSEIAITWIYIIKGQEASKETEEEKATIVPNKKQEFKAPSDAVQSKAIIKCAGPGKVKLTW